MFANLTGWHALIILAVVVLIFGAAKLPALARSLGQSVRILKDESTDKDERAVPATAPATTAMPTVATATAEPATTATSVTRSES